MGKNFYVPCVLIIATITTVSVGKADSRREEPGFISVNAAPHRVSVGLMQTLISTIGETLHNDKIDSKWFKIPQSL